MGARATLNSALASPSLAGATETGALGLYQLKRLWSRSLAARHGRFFPATTHDRHLDKLVIHASGLGLEQTLGYLGSQTPSFEDFERWIVATTGGVAPARAARINAAIAGLPPPPESARRIAAIEASAPVLSEADLSFWRENGHVVLHDAVTPEQSATAARAVWEHVGAAPHDPETWYPANDHGIMVQYFQHPAFEAVKTPIPFGTGGILYLTDTPPAQGAFTLVPGFQRWGEKWLKSLPPDADPRAQDLYALGPRTIGGRAGDLVIWHQALPHGASPNLGARPRLVQYINMFPTHYEEQEEWI
ncbi:MAG: phytanoyl-CoA dioxygenase family protein [Xanthobacteraceae bacterium]